MGRQSRSPEISKGVMSHQTKRMSVICDDMTMLPQDVHDLPEHASAAQGCGVHGVTN